MWTVNGGGFADPTNPICHGGGEETSWESVGNGWTEEVGIPGGDDPSPWIQFTFPQPQKISSIAFWNFAEEGRAIYQAEILADATNSLGNFTFATNLVYVAGCVAMETIQLPAPVTTSSLRFVILENGDGITFPATTNGFTTLVGLGAVRFSIATPPAPLLSITAAGFSNIVSWPSQTGYLYQLSSEE